MVGLIWEKSIENTLFVVDISNIIFKFFLLTFSSVYLFVGLVHKAHIQTHMHKMYPVILTAKC